jgi:hypothetical protein
MTQYEHPSIAPAERYGSDAAFVAAHGHEPRVVDNCDGEGCGEPIYEGQVYYTLNGRSYCESCIEYARTTAELPDTDEDDAEVCEAELYDPADESGFKD